MSDAQQWDRETDVVVVGSGAAALSAALAASAAGARVVVMEKASVLGGTSAMSGAGTWIPANHHMLAAGMSDTPEEALTYLRATAPAGWHTEEDALWQAFVQQAPSALKFIEDNTPLKFELVHHPDLYVEAPGGKLSGRMVSPLPISRNILGIWRDRIRGSTMPQIFTYRELIVGSILSRPVRSLLAMAPTLLYRWLTRRVGKGNALITGLLRGCLDRGCEIMIGTAAERLVTEDASGGRVCGVEARAGAQPVRIRAHKGVVLATGGFEWDPDLRAQHFPGEVGLIASPRTNTGDGHKMAAAVGAELARMDQANIYACTVTTYEGERHGLPLNELYSPHCLLVNRYGKRFVNEGDPNVGVTLDTRDPVTGEPVHLPCWRIFDAQYAARHPVGMWFARRDRGWLRKSDSIAGLARAIALDPAALQATVERFNDFVRAGKDSDFNRGETEWERFYTGDDARLNGNGALGTIAKAPFYAAPYHRAILGTKGGPRTNERGQVLRADGSLIGGLYCAGIAMANPIGTKAVGAGTTIGPCLTWGYICGRNALRENA